MTLLPKCLLVAALAVAAPAFAADPAPAAVATHPDTSKLLDQLQAKYAPVSVLRGSFVQTSGSPLYGETVVKGTVLLERPGKMRWEFADGRQFVSDGATMWIYTPADKQVIRIKDFGAQAATADAVLQSMHKLRELFEVNVTASDPKVGHELVLSPKVGQEAQFKKLGLKLDTKLMFDEIRITDPFDTVTRIDFQTIEVGGAVTPDVFTFRIPEGVQVIDAGS